MTRHVGARLGAPWLCALILVAMRDDPGAAGARPAADASLRVLRSAVISADNAANPHVESHLAVNPRDPAHLLATSMVSEGGDSSSHVYVSRDGGRHWTRSAIVQPIAGERGGDPVVYFTPKGTPLFVLSQRVEGRSATVIRRSTDGGASFGPPQILPYRDREWLAFDTSGTTLDGTTYLAGAISRATRDNEFADTFVLSNSRDDGRSFTPGELLMHDEGGSDPNAFLRGTLADLLVDADGRLILPFASSRRPRGNEGDAAVDRVSSSVLSMLVSDDGGRSFAGMRDGPERRMGRGFRGIRASGAARAAVDLSRSPERGRVYIAWPHFEEAEDRYVVRLAWTSDLGKSWGSTIVSDNPAGRDVSNPTVAVGPDGIVMVLWNDRRDDPKADCFRPYGAVSIDGGLTFQPDVKLNDSPACPNTPANWQLRAWYQYDYWTDRARPLPGLGLTALVPVRFPQGGDTQGLAADRDGIFHAGWITGVADVMQLGHAAIEVDPALVAAARARQATAPRTTTSSTATPAPAGREDLSQSLTFDISAPAIDFDKGRLSVSMRVVNSSARTVRAPIDVVIDRLLSIRSQAMGLKNLKVANADNGVAGVGATWTFEAGPGGALPPGAKSPARRLEFTFEGGYPAEPAGYFEPVFRIYAAGTEAPPPSTSGPRPPARHD